MLFASHLARTNLASDLEHCGLLLRVSPDTLLCLP
jgi:hypothetical protein